VIPGSPLWLLTEEQRKDVYGPFAHKPLMVLDRVGIRRLFVYIQDRIKTCFDERCLAEGTWREISDHIHDFIVKFMYELYDRKAFKHFGVRDYFTDVEERHILIMVQPVADVPHVVMNLDITGRKLDMSNPKSM